MLLMPFYIGVVIGLEMSAFTVSEGSGSFEATVKVLNGNVNSPVMVGVSTFSRTALG